MPLEDDDLALTLKHCLESGSPRSWNQFVARAQPIIAGTVLRSLARWGRTDSNLADDLIQDTFLKLCAKNCHVLRSFRGGETHFLCAYLRTIASSVVADYLNASSAIMRGGQVQSISLDDPAAGDVPAASAPLEEIESNLILSRVEDCLSTHKDRDRHIFWLYHRHGYTPEDISRYPGIGVGKGGVETIIYRVTKLIRDCVKKGMAPVQSVEGATA